MDRFHFESYSQKVSKPTCSAASRPASFGNSGSLGNLRKHLVYAVLLGTSLFTGCRRAAFNEFYVENMAGEIRALEDRIYEYDSAYSALEIENEDLRKAIAELRSKNYAPPTTDSWGSGGEEIRLVPRNQRSGRSNSGAIELGPSNASPNNAPHSTAEEIDLSPKSSAPKNSAPRRTPATSPNDKSSAKAGQSLLLEEVPPEALSKPHTAVPNGPRSAPPPVVPLLPEGAESSVDELPAPATLPSTRGIETPGFGNPKPNGAGGSSKLPSDKELDLDFQMPTRARVPVGQPLGTSNPSHKQKSASPQRLANLPEMSQFSIEKGKVKLPLDPNVVPASVQVPMKAKSSDMKLVEIGFHPTLSRGHNFDEKPGDDGLYLVITPLNSSGEVLNEIGNLTIVVEETKEDMSRRIAAWEVTPQELQDSLEPIGASQGFHLSLPWDETVPEGNQVQVFLKYSLPDGRTLVNRKDFNMRKPGSRHTTWTPR